MLKISRSTSLMMLAGLLCVGMQVHAVNGTNIASSVTQQTTKITGTVIDDLGPVAGASVVIKGTTVGSITDMNGNFSLSGKPGDVIQISFIGYVTQEIKYTGQSSINVKLVEDTQKLDEVVVTALGMKRSEKALGYAVTELKSEDLTNQSPDVYDVDNDNEYWLRKEDKLVKFKNEKSFLKLFGEEHRPAIKTYIKEEKINMKSVPDVLKLADFSSRFLVSD